MQLAKHFHRFYKYSETTTDQSQIFIKDNHSLMSGSDSFVKIFNFSKYHKIHFKYITKQ